MLKKTILVIDDSDSFRQFMKNKLEERFEVTLANTAADGFSTFEAQRFDLVITGYYLGSGPNGIEVIDRIREMRADQPILLVSGRASRAMAAETAQRDVLCVPKSTINGGFVDLLDAVIRYGQEHL